MPTFRPYQRGDLRAVIGLCQLEAWPSFPADPERAHRAMTAPGVTTMVAVDGAAGVVGFACLQSDGEIQAHLSLIAVHPGHRRRGIARALIGEALRVAGGERIDLVTDSAEGFYTNLAHRRMAGFRIYPTLDPGAPVATEAPRTRPAGEADRDWVVEVLTERWGAPVIVSRGRTHDASALPAVVAEVGGQRLGLVTYRAEGGEAEVVSMDALVAGRGIGTACWRR